MLTYGTLFSGIDGFAVAFDRLGWNLRWQVERDPFCLEVLKRHWPDVPKHHDVRDVGAAELERVDVIAGGFPCTDLSKAKRHREGLDGAQSGLWSEMHRIVRELRPRYVVVENVADLLADGMGRVLGDLAAIGLDAEWDVLPASAFGAPHRRERIWIVAYPNSQGLQGLHEARRGERLQPATGALRRDWPSEPEVARVADGVPRRLVRSEIQALGNALVPAIPEWIGRRIVEHEQGRLAS